MPANLVERLRAACVGHPHAKVAWPHRMLHEAAAEIERLEAERDAAIDEDWVARPAYEAAMKLCSAAEARSRAAEAQRDKLKEAVQLHDLAAAEFEAILGGDYADTNGHAFDLIEAARARAREALEQVGKR